MGPDGNPYFAALNPAVAYNPAGNEYLIVWFGDDNTGSLVDNWRMHDFSDASPTMVSGQMACSSSSWLTSRPARRSR
jgi:hypothetical protein